MTYLAIYLYVVGVCLNVHLGQNILKLKGEQVDVLPAVIGAMLWPITSPYYMVKRIIRAQRM